MRTTPISRWLRTFIIAIATVCICLVSWLPMSNAWALAQIRLFDVDYKECPEEVAEGTVTSGGSAMPANCFIVYGKTENKSGKPVYNADIFGRIYDANNNPVMQNRTRLGSIDLVEPGVGEFELRITVSDILPTPLKLEQFKASGFTGQVRR
jgi:hypothetical protein